MNRRQIALKLTLDELGMTPTMSNFDERLILQKALYLVQQAGVHLGYSYSWYLRGPYSPDLTADAFANLSAAAPDGWVIDPSTKDKLGRIQPLLRAVLAGPCPARELEKLASVLFVIKTGQAPANDDAAIAGLLQKAGKSFSPGDVNDAVRDLREQWRLIEA